MLSILATYRVLARRCPSGSESSGWGGPLRHGVLRKSRRLALLHPMTAMVKPLGVVDIGYVV